MIQDEDADQEIGDDDSEDTGESTLSSDILKTIWIIKRRSVM